VAAAVRVPSLGDLSRAHGQGCACALGLGSASLGLPLDSQTGIRSELEARHLQDNLAALIELVAAASHGHAPRPAYVCSLTQAIEEFIARECPTGGWVHEAIPTVGWRQYEHPGLDSAAERWRDDWDGVDWSEWTRGSLDAQTTSAQVRWRLAALADLDFEYWTSQARSHEEWIYRRVIGRPWAESREDEDDFGTAHWSYEDQLRALNALHSTPGIPPSPSQAYSSGRAEELQRHPLEVLALLRYVYRCERGMIAADAATRLVLDTYPTTASTALQRRLEMMDSVKPTALLDEVLGDEDELLEETEEPLSLPEPLLTAVEDGGPDPLAVVRRLLPGGEGTRGVPPIVYTPTWLDQHLMPYLLALPNATLVVLSGNAGDGKTAFISRVLHGSGRTYIPGMNEQDLILAEKRYRVVLDGSEDSESRTNEDLLCDVLSAFAGPTRVDSPERGTIIAINKGRLLRFLEAEQGQFPYLWAVISGAFLGRSGPVDHPYILVDLNERSVVAPDSDRSIYAGVVERLVSWAAWDDECGRCDAREECPVRFNVELLRESGVRRQVKVCQTHSTLVSCRCSCSWMLCTKLATLATVRPPLPNCCPVTSGRSQGTTDLRAPIRASPRPDIQLAGGRQP